LSTLNEFLSIKHLGNEQKRYVIFSDIQVQGKQNELQKLYFLN